MTTLDSLAKSKFRSSFRLTKKDLEYIERMGMKKIRSHAEDFITARLAPAEPENDGKQTPFRGHPVFKAQHATATCCRGCLFKWHEIEKRRRLTPVEISRIVDLIMQWIDNKQLR